MKKIFYFLIKILPKVIIYLFCARFFFENVIKLWIEYLEFETNVLVEYKVPTRIQFPAITLCGCCLKKPVRFNQPSNQTFHEDYVLLSNYSVLDIFDQFSYHPKNLVISCTLEADHDTDKPNKWLNISLDSIVLESINQGRKCFTYLSKLPDYITGNEQNENKIIDYHKIINVQMIIKLESFETDYDKVLDPDVIVGIHSPDSLPSFLETEFLRVYPGLSHSLKFKTFVTHLMPAPYRTFCAKHSHKQRPRSRSECINMCIIDETIRMQQKNNRTICINYYNLVTRGMILEHPELKFCTKRNYLEYYRHILARRKCYRNCDRNCKEEYYFRTFELTYTDDDIPIARVSISAKHEIVNTVTHESKMSVFEMIGFLGGHAHFWLGLSVIQFYDLFEKLFFRLRYYIEKLYKF